MAIVENCITVPLLQAFELFAQRIVVRLMIELLAFVDFINGGRLSGVVNFIAIEGCAVQASVTGSKMWMSELVVGLSPPPTTNTRPSARRLLQAVRARRRIGDAR